MWGRSKGSSFGLHTTKTLCPSTLRFRNAWPRAKESNDEKDVRFADPHYYEWP